jgi:hypothetical protein
MHLKSEYGICRTRAGLSGFAKKNPARGAVSDVLVNPS